MMFFHVYMYVCVHSRAFATFLKAPDPDAKKYCEALTWLQADFLFFLLAVGLSLDPRGPCTACLMTVVPKPTAGWDFGTPFWGMFNIPQGHEVKEPYQHRHQEVSDAADVVTKVGSDCAGDDERASRP